MPRDRRAGSRNRRALGRAANRGVDDDARQQSPGRIFFGGRFQDFRRRTSLLSVQGHRRREEIRKKIRGRFTGHENGIPAGQGKFCAGRAGGISIFAAGKFLRKVPPSKAIVAAAATGLISSSHGPGEFVSGVFLLAEA